MVVVRRLLPLFLLLPLILVGGGIAFTTLAVFPTFQFTDLESDRTPAPLRNRTWTDPPSDRLWTVGTDGAEPSFLLNASSVRTGPDGTVFVLDRGDLSIKVFDAEGRFLHTVAGTRGRGPGDLVNPTDFDVDDRGRVWIADPPNGRVSVYGPQGSGPRTLSLKRRPDRIAVPGKGGTFYLAWLTPTEDALFARYNEDGTRVQEMGPVVENQVERGMALDGWIDVGSDEALYYTTTRAGRLMRFGEGGNKTLDVETVDPAPLPEVIVDERGGRRVDPSASILHMGLQVVQNAVYVYSIVPDHSEVERAFDVYDTSGRYEQSLPLPDDLADARITPDRIYTLTDTSLTAWVRPESSAE